MKKEWSFSLHSSEPGQLNTNLEDLSLTELRRLVQREQSDKQDLIWKLRQLELKISNLQGDLAIEKARYR